MRSRVLREGGWRREHVCPERERVNRDEREREWEWEWEWEKEAHRRGQRSEGGSSEGANGTNVTSVDP